MKVTLKKAIEICVLLEDIAPSCGCHVALTGGTLYKTGERKDVDILFYRIRQAPVIDTVKLIAKMESLGFSLNEFSGGWLLKGAYQGVSIDFFFPENEGDEAYTKEEIEAKKEAMHHKQMKREFGRINSTIN